MSPLSSERTPALLVLADGEVFEGEAAGAPTPVVTGEAVFNTALSGYQEVITDPSYAGQVVAFTYPHIGNYGTNGIDNESDRPYLRGVIVRELCTTASSWRSTEELEDFFIRHSVSVITGVDTRRLTRHLRHHGAMGCAFGTADERKLLAAAKAEPGTDGVNLADQVTTAEAYRKGGAKLRVVALDLGIKSSIVRQLAAFAEVHVLPSTATIDQIHDLDPDGVFLSNGPGDPAAVTGATTTIAELVGKVPIFGICLGHQLLATAMGGETYKLPFGHHGANHPVADLSTGKVEITSQNHNYAVRNVPGAATTHVNLNDGVVEGISFRGGFSVQYHPEASPGPHDAHYLFDRFARLMADLKKAG